MAINYRFSSEPQGQYAHSEDILPDSQRYKDLAASGVEFAPTVKVEKPVKENLPGYEWSQTEYGDWAEVPIKKKSGSSEGGTTDTGYTEQNAAIDEEIAGLQSNKSKLDAEMATIDNEMHPVIQNLKAAFDKLIKNQEIQNKGILSNVQTAQFRTGRARYAPEIASGSVSAELSAGMGRIAGLNSEMAGTISKAKEVLKSGAKDRFTQLNDYMSKISDLRKEKNQALIDMEKNAREAEKTAFENSKTKLEMQKLSQDIITKNLDSYASGFVDINEKGEVIMASPEQIQEFADKTGYNYEQIAGAVRKKAYDLSKLSQEDRKRDLDLKKAEIETLNAGLSNAETEWQNAIKRGEFKGNFLAFVKAKASAERKPSEGGGQGAGGIYDTLDFRTANAVLAQADKFGTSEVVKKYNNIIAASNLIAGIDPKSQNPAEHQAIVYNFAKALDPDSVVREGEYNTVKKYSQSLLNKYKGEFKQAIKGTGFLSEQAIKDIQKAAENRLNAYKPQYDNLKSEYSRKIDDMAGKPVADRVLIEYESGYQPGVQGGIKLTSPDGKKEVDPTKLTPAELAEAKKAGWK